MKLIQKLPIPSKLNFFKIIKSDSFKFLRLVFNWILSISLKLIIFFNLLK